MPAAIPVCRFARDQITDPDFQYVEWRDDSLVKSFFPLDRLRNYLTSSTLEDGRGNIDAILSCPCAQCQRDWHLFNRPDISNYIDRITGRDERSDNHEDPTKTAYALFALLIYVGHPLFIIGFLEKDCHDSELERSATQPSQFSRSNLEWYTRNFSKSDVKAFNSFANEFSKSVQQFAIPHMNNGYFSEYHKDAILPFIEEKEIGRKLDREGRLTSEGANGRVFSFKIYKEYRKFPHATEVKRYARKLVETPEFKAYLEKENLQNAMRYRDKHIVKLIKAYRLGDTINLIFPLARANLDHLLRDPALDYGKKRGGPIESCNAWEQLLGVSKALSKIHGYGQSPAQSEAQKLAEKMCIHFDLKPANILVEDDGNWVITDFGQAAITYSKFGGTPRVADHFGTDGYAPPEIEDTNAEYGRRYDVWSLGCIILEVTAFVVLGYAGLIGSTEHGNFFAGLDKARSATASWDRHGGDERFFYRISPHGEHVVKEEIRNFIKFLQTRVENGFENSAKSKAFLAKVLHLIERMLKPKVEDRVDIVEVVRTLSDAVQQAAPGAPAGCAAQMVPAEGESTIGGPELSSIGLWHWAEGIKEWQSSSLDAFENEAGNMRMQCWIHHQQPLDVNFRRDHVKIVPLYAFWEPSQVGTSGDWIRFLSFTSSIPSEVSNTRFSLSGNSALEDARVVQSKLTSQHISASFGLANVKLKKFVPVQDIVVNSVLRKFGSTTAEKKAEEMQRAVELGSATIQLWVEQVDAAAEKRRRRHSASSQANKSSRGPRTEPQFQSGYRIIPPCRVVIYLHKHKFICTIKMDVNWVLSESATDQSVIFFEPHQPSRDPHFVASWLRPTSEELQTDFPAGIPLSPAMLQYFEDQDRFEADLFELRFDTLDGRHDFWRSYMEVKKPWDLARRDLVKQQGYMPVNRRPEHFPHPDFDHAISIPTPKHKARFSFDPTSPPVSTADKVTLAASEIKIQKGKGRAVQQAEFQENDVHSHGTIEHLTVPVEHLHPRKPVISMVARRATESIPSEERAPRWVNGRGPRSGPPRRKPG